MPTLNRIEKNYFGVTLYVTTTRTGKEYACRADQGHWTHTLGGGLDVPIQTWPGYGHYKGVVHLNRRQQQAFLDAFKMEV